MFIVKVSSFPIIGLTINRFNATSIKIPGFFLKHKLILKFIQKGTDPRIAKTILTKKWMEESFYSILRFTMYLQSSVLCERSRWTDTKISGKKNKTENPEIDPSADYWF